MNSDLPLEADDGWQRRPLVMTRLLLVGVALPGMIASVNYVLLALDGGGSQLSLELAGRFAWYVVQVGLVGFAAGYVLTHSVLRWIVFAWVLLLIDLLAAAFAMDRPDPHSALLSAGLWSGQMGLCVVWAFLGDTRWPLRWPAMALGMAALYFLWIGFGNTWGQRIWTELLALQVATLSVMCGILYLAGFRLRIVARDDPLPGQAGQRRPLQFGIKHVLIWTTALAVLLGIAKGMDLLRWQVAIDAVRSGFPWKLSVATVSAMVIVVALWVALGRGHWLARYACGLLFVAALGAGLSLWSKANAASIRTTVWNRWTVETYELLQWYEVGWWWMGWMFLSGGLLAATLIILRVLGYRLVRMRRITSVAADELARVR